VTNKCRRIL